MGNIFNRLQFVKGLNPESENGVFQTREDAVNYVLEKQVIDRPSIVAEPIVLLYENEDETKGPNVILAIGSVGDGETPSVANRTFFIDFQKTEDEIAELDEKIEAAIKSLTLIPIESDTLDFHSEKTDDGTYVSGDVKVASAQVISGISRDNKIKVVGNEGLFLYVNVEYTDDGKLIFRVNDEVEEFSIPSVVSGEYVYTGDDAENIVLTQNDGSKVKIDVGHLIDEWTVLPEDATPTPIVLNRAEVSGEPCPHGVEVWQDLLTADVRIKDEDDNILEKVNGGRELYVGGKAENIAYYENNGDRSTVKSEIDELKDSDVVINTKIDNEISRAQSAETALQTAIDNEVNRSTGKDNEHDAAIQANANAISGETSRATSAETLITDNLNQEIYERKNSAFTYVEYVSTNKIIYFKNFNGETIGSIDATDFIKDGFVDSVEIKIIEGVSYLVITFNTDAGKEAIKIPLKDIFNPDNYYTKDEIDASQAAQDEDINEISGTVNTLVSDLASEISRAQGVETVLSGAITNEVTRATSAETALSNKIDADVLAEKNRAVSAETALSGALANAKTELQTAIDNEAHYREDAINAEANRAISAETALGSAIENAKTELQTAISDEANRASSAETALSNKIDADVLAEKNRAISAETSLSDAIANTKTELQTAIDNEAHYREDAINAEANRAISAETALQTVIDNEVNRSTGKDIEHDAAIQANTNAISGETSRAKGIESIISGNVVSEETRAKAEENSIKYALSAETSNRISEDTMLSHLIQDETEKRVSGDTLLQSNIDAETTRAKSVENEISATVISNYETLDGKISDITFDFKNTNSIDFTKSGNTITANVNLRENDNIIQLGQGLYANVHLSYDITTNKIKLTTSSGSEEEYQLAGATVIDNLYYDDSKGEIVITYHDGSGNVQTVRFPASELFNEWIVDNPVQGSAIELTKTPQSKEGQPDKLSARIILSEHPDNAVVIDGNGLYVSSSAMSESKEIAECAKNEVISLKNIMGVTFGDCSSAATYSAPGTHFIVDAQSMQDADRILDDTLYHLVNDWFFLGSNTQSARLTFKDEGENRKGFVEVRLSHGNRAYDESTNNTTNEEMDYGDLEISALTDSEFSDTNVLKMVKIEESSSHEPLDPDNKYNGIFLSNIWNCGTLNSEGIPTDDYNGTETPIDYSN